MSGKIRGIGPVRVALLRLAEAKGYFIGADIAETKDGRANSPGAQLVRHGLVEWDKRHWDATGVSRYGITEKGREFLRKLEPEGK